MKNIGLIDTHSHLNFKAFAGDFLSVAQRAQEAGIKNVIIPGSNTQTSRDAVEVCREINKLLEKKWAYAAVGIHPIHADDGENFAEIAKLAQLPEVVAIGESGIDKFHKFAKANITAQRELFVRHIELACEVNKPIIIHNRQADAEVWEVLTFVQKCLISNDRRKWDIFPKVVFHCFSSNWTFAQKVLELGAYISFTGNITYGNPTSLFAKATGDKSLKLRGAGSNLKVVERVPLDRIMIETDAPYLVPEPEKSSGVARNEPSYVWRIARKIAEVKNLSLEVVCSQTTKNAKTFFSL